ncbi:hypothetical protein [Paenibacillus sp. SYP-B4298]|uniref:hypothetical protein n=1 Tax=Paenibacillus sp. SYP-B4298 TaxID=2996034 RepID=UPI0022DDD8FF|nr:hypothetical protein [Paenibacillus sp. SYP-B4298]
MDKLTMRAFNKLQKREHLLRVLRGQRQLGRITREAFKTDSLKIIERYQLSDEEQRAYERYAVIQRQRKRK